MLVYDDVGIYPKLKFCPKNIFNMWIPFVNEKYALEKSFI